MNKNWAQWIRKIYRRLLTATRVENRVLLLNLIVLSFHALHGDSRWIISMGGKGTAQYIQAIHVGARNNDGQQPL